MRAPVIPAFAVLALLSLGCSNTAPVAAAGQDLAVEVGSVVTLDGSASGDPDGDAISHRWSMVSRPDGSSAALSSATAAAPTFLADAAGVFKVALVVNDGEADSAADEVVITARAANRPPTAEAGEGPGVVAVGSTVTLDGSASSDPDGDALSYRWSFSAIPEGSGATLSSATSAAPSFVPDLPGTYSVALVVNDGKADSAKDEVLITAERPNRAPVAEAGEDQTVQTDAVVSLDGSASADPDGDPLSLHWALASRPEGSAAELSSASDPSPDLVPDLPGEYVVLLVVNDGTVDSEVDQVVVTATPWWREPQTVDSAGTGVSVANAGGGEAIAAWRDCSGASPNVRVARYLPATDTWTASTILESVPSEPDVVLVAAEPSGHAVVVWGHWAPEIIDLRASVYDGASEAWGPATSISGPTGGSSTRPDVSIDASGRIAVAWEQYADGRLSVWGNVYVPGAGWGTAQKIESATEQSLQAQVEIDAGGRAVVVWMYEATVNRYRLRSNVYDFASGTWSGAQTIDPSTDAGDLTYYPILERDGLGGVTVVWTRQESSGLASLWAMRREASSGEWSGAEDIDGSDISILAIGQAVVVDHAGNCTVVFGRSRDGTMDIFVNRYDAASGAWEGATALETDDNSALSPLVASDGAGNVIAGWMQYNGSNLDLRVRPRPAGASEWGASTTITALSSDVLPVLVVSSAQRALAVWSQYGFGVRSSALR